MSASYYALSARKDVCFELGRLLMSLKVSERAAPWRFELLTMFVSCSGTVRRASFLKAPMRSAGNIT